MSYMIFAHSSSDPARMDFVNDELQDLKNYLETNTSDDWWFEDMGDCGVNCKDDKYGSGGAGEEAFIEDALDALDQNEGLVPGDNIILAHDNAVWGYGRSHPYNLPDGGEVHGCTVYAGNTAIGGWEIKGFTWHEAMHSYGADHADGRYRVGGTGDGMYGITPMCMSYLKDGDFEVDTTWSGGGNIPSEFCTGDLNYTGEYRYQDKRKNHYLSTLSSCTTNNV